MINCPRCEQPVDETVRTTCPLCFTPLRPEPDAAQPQPGVASPPAAPGPGGLGGAYGASPAAPLYQSAAPSLGAPVQPMAMPLNAPAASPGRSQNTRMTLNGDIIEAPPTPSAAAPAGGNYAPRPGAPRPNYSTPARAETRTKSGGGSSVAIVLVLLVVLGGGSFGGYYWWTHRSTPKETVTKFLNALKTQDWKTIYEQTELNDQMKSQYTSAQDFADKTKAQLDSKPGAGQLISSLFSGMKFEVQEPKDNDGNTASVPVKLTVSILGRDVTQTQNIKVKNIDGAWKVSSDVGAGGMGALGLGGGGMGGR
jgi:hypothetical protein